MRIAAFIGAVFLAEDSGHNWFVIGAIIAVFIGSSVFGVFASQKRTKKLEGLARSLGYTFRGRPTTADSELIIGCYLEELGSNPTVSNVLEVARTPELRFVFFDFEYTTTDGETSSTTPQTVARIQAPLLKLPSFLLFPETIFSKVKVMFGGADVNFPDSPRFSDKYILRGQDEARLRAIFSPALRQALESAQYVTIEGADDALFVFRAGSLLKPDEFVARIEENKRILALFFEAQQATA